MEKQDDTIDFNFERKIIKIQRKKYIYIIDIT